MFIFRTKPLSSIFVAIERPKHAKQNGLKLDIDVLSVRACGSVWRHGRFTHPKEWTIFFKIAT